jgi:glycosyltransferase 2 family protein
VRKILILVIIVLAVSLIAFRFSEIQSIGKTLQNADPVFFILAIVLQFAWFFGLAATFRSLYRIMGINERLGHLAGIAVSANFINVVAPTGGIGGVAVFVDDADKRGHPHGRVVAVSALYVFLDYLSFLILLAAGFVVLLRRNIINSGEITATVIMVILVVSFGWLLLIGIRSPEGFGRVLGKIFKGTNSLLRPILRRDYLHEEQAYLFASEVADGLAVLQKDHNSLIRPMFFLVVNRLIQIGILALCFLAFAVPFSLGTLVAGYAIGYLFLIVSPTPSGIGIVEGGLPLVLTSLHVPFEQGLIVTLTYRAVTFWIPLGLGAIAFRQSQRKKVTHNSDRPSSLS